MLGKLMLPESRFVENIVYRQVANTKELQATLDNGIHVAAIYPDYRDILTLGI